jgi:hypothetical protein
VAAPGGYAAARREAPVATTVVNPTFKDAQWLSDHAGSEGMVVSCYPDTSPSGLRPPLARTSENEVKRIDETLSGNSDGMAIFAASQHNLLQAYALASAVPNRLVIDEEPYTRWSASALHSQPTTRPRRCLPRK